jgi:hypothetical protein
MMVVRQIPKLVAGLVLLRPRWPIGENEQASEPERARGGEIGGSEEREGRRRVSASQPGREGGREGGVYIRTGSALTVAAKPLVYAPGSSPGLVTFLSIPSCTLARISR